MTTAAKVILFVGGYPLGAFSGHHHDYAMLKAEFPPDNDWFATLKVLVDLGYLGIRTDYAGTQLLLPTCSYRVSSIASTDSAAGRWFTTVCDCM